MKGHHSEPADQLSSTSAEETGRKSGRKSAKKDDDERKEKCTTGPGHVSDYGIFCAAPPTSTLPPSSSSSDLPHSPIPLSVAAHSFHLPHRTTPLHITSHTHLQPPTSHTGYISHLTHTPASHITLPPYTSHLMPTPASHITPPPYTSHLTHHEAPPFDIFDQEQDFDDPTVEEQLRTLQDSQHFKESS